MMRTLERRLTDTLRYEAERLPYEEAAHTLSPVEQNRSGSLRPSLAAPAAIAAVMVVAGPVIWLTAERGGSGLAAATTQAVTTETSQPETTTTLDTAPVFGGQLGAVIDQLPDGFDLEQASPIFVMDGGLEDTALHYLETRHLSSSVGLVGIDDQDSYTLVQWAWGRRLDETEPEQGESGWLVMRPVDDGHEILAATTDGIDLSQVTITENAHMLGSVLSNTDQFIGVDVLDLDGTPVASAPNPDGMPNADYLWGTAASGTPPLGIDVQVHQAVLFRVYRAGGTLLSISELVFGQIGEEGLREIQDDGSEIELRPEPSSDDWTDLPEGLSVAVVEGTDGRPRIWVKSAVQGPAPVPGSDIAYLPVPVSATEVAVLIPNPEFFGTPRAAESDPEGGEQTADGQAQVARIHWGFEAAEVDTVDIDWESDPRFGIAFVEGRDADIVDVEYVTSP